MSEPTTGFEDRIAAEEQPNWTSLAEEVAFLDAVVALGDRVSYKSVGKSVENRDIWLVTVGIGSNLDARRKVLIFAQQHGPEAAGREASFELIRHYQTTDDEAEIAYLESHTIYFMPTCNPDGLGNGWDDLVRNNADDLDINGHHGSYLTPESLAIHEVIRDLDPALVVDSHEANNAVQQIEYNSAQTTGIHAPLRAEADHIIADVLRPAMTALGFTNGLYTINPNRTNGVNSSGMRHAISIIIETKRNSSVPNNPVRANRVTMQRETLLEVINYHRLNAASLESLKEASKAAKIAAGRAKAAFDFQNSTVANPGPLAYRLTSAQRTTVEKQFSTWLLGAFRDGADVIVPLGQEAQPIMPFIFDAASTVSASGNVISATRLDSFDAFTNIQNSEGPLMPRRWTGRGWVEGRARRSADEGWQ
jgi:hypothetical protein